MDRCSKCQSSLEPPDSAHRYCPYCGGRRVIPDPPGSGLEGGLLVVGKETIGPRSGQVYGYLQGASEPEPLDVLSGPFQRGSHVHRDLFGASGAPLPLNAWYPYGANGHSRPMPGGQNRSLGAKLFDATVRHGRLYTLAQGQGLLYALEAENLAYAPEWPFPTWSAGQLVDGLRVSETLLYALLTAAGGTNLKAVHLGRGLPVIDQNLPFNRPQVLIAGDEMLVTGDAQGQQQALLRYSLDSFRMARTAAPTMTTTVHLIGPIQDVVPRPIRLGTWFVFTTRDGRIYGWSPGETPRVLWPNPHQARHLLHEFVPLGPNEVGCLVDARSQGEGIGLIRVRMEDGRAPDVQGAFELPLLRDSSCHAVAAVAGDLFFLVQDTGPAIYLYRTSFAENGSCTEEVQRITGAADAEVRHLMAVPAPEGGVELLIHTLISQRHDFWFVNPGTGAIRSPELHPVRTHRIRVLWEAGRIWLANLSEGQIVAL